MAFVRSVIFSFIFSTSMLQVPRSMSAKTGVPPSIFTAAASDAKQKGVVITSSPFFNPMAIKAIRKASVPELSPIACLTPR